MNHDMTIMAMGIFKTLKMATDRGGNIGVKVFALIWISVPLFRAFLYEKLFMIRIITILVPG